MNVHQHRTLVLNLQGEAAKLKAALLRDLAAEGAELSQEEQDAIRWTGQVRVFGQTVWHEFLTPGSWEGVTYYRFQANTDRLKSREPDDFQVFDYHAAWKFVQDSYDGSGHSPSRKDWTDEAIREFVREYHVDGESAFLRQPRSPR